MKALDLVTEHVIHGLDEYISMKANENYDDIEGLSIFQLHLALEILSLEAFVTKTNEEDFLSWARTSDDIRIDPKSISSYQTFKREKLNIDRDLCKLELKFLSRIFTYRQYVEDAELMPDLLEFTNELGIDLKLYEEEHGLDSNFGLVEYLIAENIII
jgi:hypothetical protein